MNKLRSGLFITLLGVAVTTCVGCGSSTPAKTDAKVDAKDGGDATAGTGGGGTGGGGTGGTDAGGSGGDAATGGTGGSDAREAGPETGNEVGGDARDGGDAGDASSDGATDAPTCTNACTLGTPQCGPNGGVRPCVMSTTTACTVLGPETACGGVQTCQSGVCRCPAAPAGCTQAGSFCSGTGTRVTCVADAQGCFTSSSAACPTDTSCKGTLPTGACTCDHQCAGSGAFCVDGNTRATCSTDNNTPACRVITGVTACLGSSTCAGGACVCPALGSNAGQGCATLDANSCSGDDILTCVTESASGCSIWQASTHCGTNPGGRLTCGIKANGAPACQCPERAGGDVYADPVAGSDAAAGVFATGIASPPACRFKTLTHGLATVPAAGRVIAISAGLPAAFTAETFPLVVPAGVALTTADAVANAADYVISFNNATATVAVSLAGGSALRGFTVSNNGGNAAATLATCAAGATTLDTVILDGASLVSAGVAVSGTCAATLTSTTIQNLTGTALNLNSSATSTVSGGTLRTSLIGLHELSGTVNVSGTSITDNGHQGVLLDTGTPSINLSGNATVKNNGFLTVGFDGVALVTGSLTASNSSFAGNGASGIASAAGTTVNLTTVDSSSNGSKVTSAGLTIAGGTVTSAGLTATANTGSGVAVGAGNVSITGATALNGNGQRGLAQASGTVTITGGVFDGNTLAGIYAPGGTLTVQGGADIRNNKTFGVHVLDATATVAGVSIHNNLGSGVVVNATTGATVNVGAPGSVTSITSNGGSGILANASPATASDANSLTVDTVSIVSNAAAGVDLKGDTGNVAATVKTSVLSGNGDAGILIEQGAANTTRSAIQGNDVFGNNTSAGRAAGGVFFITSSTLTSFVSNKIHSNVGDELGFAAVPNAGTTWDIHPASGTCDATSNSLYCYGAGNVGLRVITTGVAKVNAENTHWLNVAPAAGVDYSAPVTAPPALSQVDPANACSAIPTCP